MITDTYDVACLTIVRQALNGEISAREAQKRIKRAELITFIERQRRSGVKTPLPKWMLKRDG
jgi:hypothetical protein